ncbi:hypothetical protein IPZ58_27675 [Streptomyces roseoverticillatus]|nr:hypothetical protein [Streptomyces roseoverticillatus]
MAGGRAALYSIEGCADYFVRIYREPLSPHQERKLRRMLTMSPPLGNRPTHEPLSPELAWPTALVKSPDGAVIGYAMHCFGGPDHVLLAGLLTRSGRLRFLPRGAGWQFLLGVGWNLAFIVTRMHHEGLVIGDLSSGNVIVDRSGFVTFLDWDSIDFTDPVTEEHFPSLAWTPGYCAPERQRGGSATAAGDDFALAVLIYQLLTGGDHPYGGVSHGSSSDATVQDNIASGISYVVYPDRVTAPHSTIDPAVLPPALLQLAQAAFGRGAGDPAKRPDSAEWLRALDQERSRIQACTARPGHTYGSHLSACPWCEHADTTGLDIFNPVTPSGSLPMSAADDAPPHSDAVGGLRHPVDDRREERRRPAERRLRSRVPWQAFLDGAGGTFDLFGGAKRPREPLPAFEATLADDVHELCLALGLTAEDDN